MVFYAKVGNVRHKQQVAAQKYCRGVGGAFEIYFEAVPGIIYYPPRLEQMLGRQHKWLSCSGLHEHSISKWERRKTPVSSFHFHTYE